MSAAGLAARRARLAEIEAALAELRAEYDVRMNRFKFEEAQEIARRIETAERERAILAADLPPLPEPPAAGPPAAGPPGAIRRRPPIRRRPTGRRR